MCCLHAAQCFRFRALHRCSGMAGALQACILCIIRQTAALAEGPKQDSLVMSMTEHKSKAFDTRTGIGGMSARAAADLASARSANACLTSYQVSNVIAANTWSVKHQIYDEGSAPSGGEALCAHLAARWACLSRMRKVATPSFLLRRSSTHACAQHFHFIRSLFTEIDCNLSFL